MREIKFRAWTGEEMQMAFDLTQNPKIWWELNKDYHLMQYTGIKDRNGKDIYEGDIVEREVFPESEGLSYKKEYTVDFKYGAFRIRAKGMPLPFGKSSFYGSRLEVVGNIYEGFNPSNHANTN